MIKKLLSLLLFVIFYSTHSFAQCVPDLTITDPGIYPDSATGLPGGVVGTPYSEVIQVRVLTDTTLNGLPVIVTSITITSVSGLPPGITYSCNPASCVFPGGSNACILLSGIPTVAGSYQLIVDIEVDGTLFGVPVSQTATIDYYVIDIDVASGFAGNISAVKFELLQNKPNPAFSYTDVMFNSPVGGDFELRVFNMIGREVYAQTLRGMAGLNSVRIMTDELTPGVYMLTLGNGSTVTTRRMIVSRK